MSTLQRSGTRTAHVGPSLQRSGTRKAHDGPSLQRSGTTTRRPAGQAEPTKGYENVQQGIKEIYPLDKSGTKPDIDIVFVPGLGAHPEDSWKSPETGFNWMTDPKGIVKDFPRARILLYMYESAWTGRLKVKQFMGNIAKGLMHGLNGKREDCKTRPIVFIGHSMGGLVIAKAITMADARRDLFPVMFEAIAAALFFGTPFDGAAPAAVASMYAHVAEKFHQASSSKLLEFMRPGEESLRELKDEFLRVCGKLKYRIELWCFWEEQETDFSKMAGLPGLFGLTKAMIPKQFADFVTRGSATLDGFESLGLACNHRDLVKFDGPKDERWNLVRDPLKKLIFGAHLTAKNRVTSARDLDWGLVKSIMAALGGAPDGKKRKTLEQSVVPSTWITKETEYLQWLQMGSVQDRVPGLVKGDCLWIRGQEGRGKTGAAIAALDDIEALIKVNEDAGQDPVLLAYFLCDPSTDYCTAEDLLKSLLAQLIDRQTTLATHAKMFAKDKGKNGVNKSQAHATVENLWQSLQNMLTDEFVGRRIYFVLNNLHVLDSDSDSTMKLMEYLKVELADMNDPDPRRVSTRWLVTSRNTHSIGKALDAGGLRLVDLEDDEKYGHQVQIELRKHAKTKVAALGSEKKYDKALSYFASSLIGKRAQNIQWIDITCVQLEELPQAENDLKVRRVLEDTPQDLRVLLNNAWLQIFEANENNSESIKEMLRALTLTFEDPTEAELVVLAGLSPNELGRTELRGLVDRCKPLLTIKKTVVAFMNSAVKKHLLENSKQLLGLSVEETKWQHGVLAFRSFSHLKEVFDFPETIQEPTVDDGNTSGDPDEASPLENVEEEGDGEGEDGEGTVAGTEVAGTCTCEDCVGGPDYDDSDDDASSSDEDWDEESEYERDPEADILQDKALAYAVKHWLHHGSKATVEFADDLSLEEEFWKTGSLIRRRWLVEYSRMTTDFEGFDCKTLTGLHVAASVGFRQLVQALMRNGYQDQIHSHDSLVNTPLHMAAYFGRPKIVEELLDRGAAINDSEDMEDTPLHMAAAAGHVEVMKKLIHRGANLRAVSQSSGLVINAAIFSGKREAVELLVDRGVSLTANGDDFEPPLAQAASLSEVSMLEYLIERYSDKLPPEDYSEALVSAARAGRVPVVNRLLEFPHTTEYFQRALDEAAEEGAWEAVKILLEKCSNLNCDQPFYEAATGTEPQDIVLEALWEYTQGGISAEKLDESLYDATDREKESTVKILLDKFGADPNAAGEDYGNALTAAAYDGTMPIVKLLLDAGADVNSPNGWALQTAAAEGHYEIAELLLARGADVNAVTLNENFPQQTALQGACEFGKEDIVSLLLEHGADPNLGGGEDSPPILAAAMYGEEKILVKLVDARANVNVSGGDDDSTPLINAAASIPGVDCLKKLLDAGANINLSDSDGNTALIAASEAGDEEVVQFLLDHGADVMHLNDEGKNALQVAMEEEEEDCVKVLVKHISIILAALKGAMDAGNAEVIGVVRSATASGQGLNYDDNSRHKDIQTSPEQRGGGGGGVRGPAPDKNKNQYGFEDHYASFQPNAAATYPGKPLVESYAAGLEAQRTTFQQAQTTVEVQTTPSKQSYGQPPITPPQQQMADLRTYQQVASFQQDAQTYPAKTPEPWSQERNEYSSYAGQPTQSLAEQQTIKRKPAPMAQGSEQFRTTPPPTHQNAGSTASFGASAPIYAAYRPRIASASSRKDQYTTYTPNLRQDPESITANPALPPNRPPYTTTQSQPSNPAPGPSAFNPVQDVSLYDGSQYGPLEVPHQDDSLRNATRYPGQSGLRIQTPQAAASQNVIKAYPGQQQRPYPQKSHTSPGPIQNYPDPWGNQGRLDNVAQHQGYSEQYPSGGNRPRQEVPPQRPGFYGN